MKPAPFEYHAPSSTEEAVALLAELGDDAKVIAGGQSLTPMLAMRLAVFSHLVDVARIPELRGITSEDSMLTVGAATRDSYVERDPFVAACVPLVAKATPWIGHFQIRNRGTVGGSVAHADPAAEYPAVALALDASLDLVSSTATRRVAAADFFQGVWSTAIESDELLVALHFPVWIDRCGFGIREFARRHGDFALAGAVAAVGTGTDGRIDRAAIGLFGLGSTPLRGGLAEQALVGTRPGEIADDEVGHLCIEGVDDPPEDLHAPAAYRRRIGAAMAAGAWRLALEDLDA